MQNLTDSNYLIFLSYLYRNNKISFSDDSKEIYSQLFGMVYDVKIGKSTNNQR